jgi:hypothetical protein
MTWIVNNDVPYEPGWILAQAAAVRFTVTLCGKLGLARPSRTCEWM